MVKRPSALTTDPRYVSGRLWHDDGTSTIETDIPIAGKCRHKTIRKFRPTRVFASRGTLWGWTDYPLVVLGDLPGKKALWRLVEVVWYDFNKYAYVRLPSGDFTSFKMGYIHRFSGGPVGIFP